MAEPETTGVRRSAGQWFVLLVSWLVGLAVWALYILAFGYVLFRFVL